ncbi:hypothetical protein SSIL_1541 [Solibacillus silvestris StLB046]|uniref:Uncharacterized protein n=1 Tax=Solibacillus silvestris (strain StLB046) TaxID=1002809 RepID=F2F4I0_SOLSS|nr:hypothetical protein SSIL_1541 [Solibacillus silvestris StLB046]
MFEDYFQTIPFLFVCKAKCESNGIILVQVLASEGNKHDYIYTDDATIFTRKTRLQGCFFILPFRRFL